MTTGDNAAHRSPQAARSDGRLVLMYHALSDDGLVPRGQDPRYTLQTNAFEAQLDAVSGCGGAGSVRDWLEGTRDTPTLLTFDDGHVSNITLALPALLARGMSADFFVNPANVGTPGFASWPELRRMSDAGMSIQSHGYEHIYLTTLGSSALRDNLRRSRETIEQQIGHPVTLLAPPGGRMPPGLSATAIECGYRVVLSSRPGLAPARSESLHDMPRMSVTAQTELATLQQWLRRSPTAIGRERVRYGMLALAKRVMGNARYERIRSRALAGGGGAA